MLMSFFSHILSAWFAFLLPSYATFKALSHRPLSEPELQRWAMYWSVVGAFVAFEYTAEWFISWCVINLSSSFKFLSHANLTIFATQNTLLALPCPSTNPGKSEAPLSKIARVITISQYTSRQGSTYIYTTYLQPFFSQNEADLDEGIVQAQKNILTFIQTRLTALWEYLLNAANKRQATTSTAAGSSNTSSAPNGSASALQSVFGLWQTYGPSVLSALGTKGTTSVVASSSSVQGASGAATQRGSAQASNNNLHSTTASPAPTPSPENPNPSFPEPYHF
ncbi:hypothetical protein D9756_006058 [Leucocoprinus leucothites]|uniref:Protein YOP1 n=1 Tax=Leucocoprinus leucothites TaxID=201217 RepID=A0A8H5D388_9AGAR|nr:hypothetical protein D9756_006058 [Leucoagaricus leucothites]